MKALSVIAFLLPGVTFANDGWWSDSGTAQPFGSKHKEIQIVKEHIHFDFRGHDAKVTITFEFKNTGKATTVTMGFPETQKWYRGDLDNFRSWVDGKEVDVVHRVLQDPDDSTDDELEYKAVWLKTVSFKSGQTRTVKVRYFQQLSFTTAGTRTFDYILKTGATWKGKINEVLVTYDAKDAYPESAPYFIRAGKSPTYIPPTRTGKDTGQFVFKNLEPDFNLQVNFSMSQWSVVINGVVIDPGLFNRQPRLKLDDVQVPLDAIEDIFSLSQPFQDEVSKPWRLLGRELDLKATTFKRGIIKVTIDEDDVADYVFLKDVIEVLGGSYRYDHELGTVYITVPIRPN